ncbi:Hypothetical protein A7982_06446 [Minicystis rosea]|nr:Hypothetical protein A7982_06446 [Minicystis rosea]
MKPRPLDQRTVRSGRCGRRWQRLASSDSLAARRGRADRNEGGGSFMIVDRAEVLGTLETLRALADAPETEHRVSDLARERADAIRISQDYLDRRDHSIAFVGQIGIGKSSMIGVLAGLLVGAAPRDRASLRENSVLAVGSGGTTVCEVRIRAASVTESGRIGLIIQPLTVEEMRREIRLFAADEWARRRSPDRTRSDDDRDPTPREIQRVIRHMAALVERSEMSGEGGQRRKRTVDPLDDVVAQHDSAGSLANHLLERATLLTRTDTEWWWDVGPDAYRELKQRFDDINHGRTPTAMLPSRITIVVPRALLDLTDGLDVELIDTRGFDGQLASRADIQSVLRDPRALIVTCVPFKDAPGDSIKSLLSEVLSDAELRAAVPQMLLVLMDHGDAEGVNDCNGDREFGQELKQGECRRVLDAAGLDAFSAENNVTSFDTLRDAPGRLLHIFDSRIQAMRANVAASLDGQIRDAKSFLGNLENVRIELARAEVDKRLRVALKANFPSGAPLRDPLEGLYAGIYGHRYASQVLASCRRDGSYPSMDAYAAIRTGAAKAATNWFKALDMAMVGLFRALEHDEDFADVSDHVRLRRDQYTNGHVASIRKYADSVVKEVRAALESASVWERCADEWGQGSGFKDRVIDHLKIWCRSQGQLQAHQHVVAPLALLEGTTATG